MSLSDFDYELPEELIAQQPADKRSDSRLLVCRRQTGTLVESTFAQVGDFLRDDDLLVINNARVLKARLHARKATGGQVELLLVSPQSEDSWLAMVKPARRVRAGSTLTIGWVGGEEAVAVVEERERGQRILRFSAPGRAEAVMEATGSLPLPPYVREPGAVEDRRYQTIYASVPGAVAAPTAGLHFTRPLMASLQERGVEFVEVTLNVGPGTFLPLSQAQLDSGRLHREEFSVSADGAARICQASAAGRRVIAVGTTSLRVIESLGLEGLAQGARTGSTDLFIRPGYQFRVAKALLTNFHLPGTSLLCLVAACAGVELIKRAYRRAIERRFRFYSFGDAMLIMD